MIGTVLTNDLRQTRTFVLPRRRAFYDLAFTTRSVPGRRPRAAPLLQLRAFRRFAAPPRRNREFGFVRCTLPEPLVFPFGLAPAPCTSGADRAHDLNAKRGMLDGGATRLSLIQRI